MDHRRFLRTALVCAAAGAAASFAVFEATPVLCLAFLTVTDRRPAGPCAALGTALLGAWLFIGGPWLLCAMGVAFALCLAAPARAAGSGRPAAGSGRAVALALAAPLSALVALAAPWATHLADSITAPAAGAAFGLWFGLCTLPLHRTLSVPAPRPTQA